MLAAYADAVSVGIVEQDLVCTPGLADDLLVIGLCDRLEVLDAQIDESGARSITCMLREEQAQLVAND